MKRWVEGFCCQSCSSRLGLNIDGKHICFVCENESQQLKEAFNEGEDFPEVLEAQGKHLGAVNQILSNLNTPSHISEKNIIDEKYSEFIEVVGICDELEYVDMNILFKIARNLKNAEKKKRADNKNRKRRKVSRISPKRKRSIPKIPIAA